REGAEREPDANLAAEPRAPLLLVALQADVAQVVVAERPVQDGAGDLPADQAVVDAAAGRRLDEPGGVADREQPRAVGPRNRPEREDLQARVGPAVRVDVEAGAGAAREVAKPVQCPRFAHQPEARVRPTLALEGHEPG